MFVHHSFIGQDAGYPNLWEYLIFVMISATQWNSIPHAKLQSEWFELIPLQAEYPASFKVMNKTWQPIHPFQDQKREMLQFLDLPAVHEKRSLWQELEYQLLLKHYLNYDLSQHKVTKAPFK